MKKKIIGALAAVFASVSAIFAGINMGKKIKEQDKALAKVHELYMLFDQWVQVKQEDKSLVEYFRKNEYRTIAIYGMKELGERLYDELKNSDIKVSYVIDKNADKIYADVNVVTPDEELDPVDVIVVTAVYYFNEIEEVLNKKVNYPIVSLEDVLYEV